MLHQIGSGVLGPVFRTYEPQRDRLVAVKVFKLDLVPEDVARLAEALRRLAATPTTHPGIVRVLDAGLEGTSPFVAMDYASGESLDVALRDLAPAPLGRALPLLIDVARAIDAAWSDGRGHGALHPRDIIVSPGASDTRVTGFGIVPALESIGVRPGARRPYTAPERVAGAPWDIRSDVYSLGVIAHELLTGRRPVGSGEQDGTLAMDLTPEQRVSVRRVLGAALSENPQERYDTACAFVSELEAVARGEAAKVPAPAAEVAQVPASAAEAAVVSAPAAEVAKVPAPAAEVAVAADEVTAVVEPSAEATKQHPQPLEAMSDFPSEVASVPAATADAVPAAVPATPRIWQPGQTDAPRTSPPAQHEARSVWQFDAKPKVDAPAGTKQPALVARHPAPSTKPITPGTRQLALGTQHSALSTQHSVPVIDPSTLEVRHPYPWSAIAAVAAASLLAGGVIGYQLGLRRVESVVSQVTSGAPGGRAMTDVPVTAEPPAQKPTDESGTPRESRPTGPVAALKKPADTTPPRAAPSAARVADVRGRIVVRSVPSGALVTVDGRLQGETPLTIRDLVLGAHTLQIARPGYVPRTDRITLTPATPARTIAVELEPGVDTTKAALSTGSLFVDSRPRGARVSIDGRPVGTTPLQLPEVAIGRRAVRLELAGHKPLATEVAVKPGAPARLAVTLEQVR